MPKFFCDYCDVYLTHDSMSVRKAHNNGRNHLRNVQAYYEQISSDQTQQVINSITDAYNSEGQANPLYQANLSGGFAGGPMGGMGMGMGMGMGPPMGMPPMGGMPGFPPPGTRFRGRECRKTADSE
jgi:U1 small nuclear ribonucleoprotein C